jgi:hypothetical protein
MTPLERRAWAGLAMAICMLLAGCGTPGAPQPPSLNLPDPVGDLSAVRAGNKVALAWTMPRRNTDRLLLKADVEVQICRREGTSTCEPVGGNIMLAPGKDAGFDDALPAALASGPPRPLRYFVELKNRKGRSAGLSNEAVVLAGQSPSPIDGLRAEVRRDGIVLNWNPQSDSNIVRLQRKLLTPPSVPQKSQQLLAPPPEQTEENLLVESKSGSARAIDKDIRLGESYQYRAQRVSRVSFEGKMLELNGEFSPAIQVDAKDIFPPAVPAGLAAIATAPESGLETAIDLNWEPDAEADLAGYIVYRREGENAWHRISPDQPIAAPAFHDTHVQPGHTYRYAVSAIDRRGHESARSPETEEAVPNP